MRKKLRGEGGLTLVELLAAVVILILLGLLLNTGLQMAVRTYRAVTAQSEVELLLSTAVDALADDLRYARDVSADGVGFTYTSDSYGAGTSLTVDENGQILANGKRVLPTGAYGLKGAYRVKEMEIGYAEPNFTIELTITTKDEAISAGTSVTVRCLNGKRDGATGGGP